MIYQHYRIFISKKTVWLKSLTNLTPRVRGPMSTTDDRHPPGGFLDRSPGESLNPPRLREPALAHYRSPIVRGVTIDRTKK